VKTKVDEWEMIDVNIKGVLHGIAAALPIFQQESGHFINLSSAAGKVFSPEEQFTAVLNCRVLSLKAYVT
jgi:NADP-dependent 3-hydroxy acid dehydrogenase YdfG